MTYNSLFYHYKMAENILSAIVKCNISFCSHQYCKQPTQEPDNVLQVVFILITKNWMYPACDMNRIQKKRVLPENQFSWEWLFDHEIKDFMGNDTKNLATFNTCIIKVWHNSWNMVHYVLMYLPCTTMHTRILIWFFC